MREYERRQHRIADALALKRMDTKGAVEQEKKMPKAMAFGSRRCCHLCAALEGAAGVKRLPSSQRFHPARIVAGAGILWHASAHKRNPLFHRRTPVLSTTDPKGSLDISRARNVKGPLGISPKHTEEAFANYDSRTVPSHFAGMALTKMHARFRRIGCA